MGKIVRLTAADGHELEAWQAIPEGIPKAGLVVIQEIFGVTDHIRRVTDGFADDGYLAVAPALFDRIAPGIRLDYSEVERGRDTMQKLDVDKVVEDIAAAADAVRSAGKIAVVGYCWGGAMADLAACRLDIDAAAAYYGRMIVNWLDQRPRRPVIYHFGGKDPLIPPEMVEQICAARPDGECFVYPDAGHGFNCDERADFDPDAAALARQRTLEFFSRYL